MTLVRQHFIFYDIMFWSVKLAEKGLPVVNPKTKENITLSYKDGYLDIYKRAYILGTEEFNSKFAVLRGSHAHEYKSALLEHYYSDPGWINWKKREPLIINEDVITQFGFYAGVLSEADQFLPIFQSGKIEEVKLSLSEIALLYNYMGRLAIPNEKIANEIAESFGHTSGRKLMGYFGKYLDHPERVNDRGRTQDNNKHRKRFKRILEVARRDFPDLVNSIQSEYEQFLRNIKI